MIEPRPLQPGDSVRLKSMYEREPFPQSGTVAKATDFGVGQVIRINDRWLLAGYYERGEAK